MEIFNHTVSGLSVYVTHKKGRPYMTYSFNEENMIEYSLLKDKDINFDELSIEMTRKFLMMAVHSSYLRVNNFSSVIEDMLKICQLIVALPSKTLSRQVQVLFIEKTMNLLNKFRYFAVRTITNKKEWKNEIGQNILENLLFIIFILHSALIIVDDGKERADSRQNSESQEGKNCS